jgi:hypothetical protein
MPSKLSRLHPKRDLSAFGSANQSETAGRATAAPGYFRKL